MVLTQFELENFKSFLTRQKLPLAPITLLYGPNGGGKSSVIQALLALRQTFDAGQCEFNADGRDVKLGGFESVVSRHDLSRNVTLAYRRPLDFGQNGQIDCGLEFQYGKQDASATLPAIPGMASTVLKEMTACWAGSNPGRCKVKASRCEHVPRAATVEQITSLMARDGASGKQSWEIATNTLFQAVDSLQEVLSLHPWLQNAEVMRATRDWLAAEGPVCLPLHYIRRNEAGIPGVICDTTNGAWDPTAEIVPFRYGGNVDLPKTLEMIGTVWSTLTDDGVPPLTHLIHIEPLRQLPERIYLTSGLSRASSASPFEAQDHWADHLASAGPLLDIVNAYLSHFGFRYKLRVESVDLEGATGYYQILLDDLTTRTTVTLADVGFGISQLLPMMAHALLKPAPSKMIVVQQPELHLHPRMQGHLADFFIDTSCAREHRFDTLRYASFQSQWIIETHSEALITRIQRRIREGSVKPSDVSVLYVDRIDDLGSVVTPLRLGDNGEFLDEWPGGFFEDGFDDLFGIDE